MDCRVLEPTRPCHRHGHTARNGNRIGHIQNAVFDQASEHARHQDVKNRADNQGSQNADGHVAPGIFRFLRGGRDGVKSDVGEEDYARCGRDTGDTKVAISASVRRDEWRPISNRFSSVRQNIVHAQGDENQQHRNFYHHNGRVEVC